MSEKQKMIWNNVITEKLSLIRKVTAVNLAVMCTLKPLESLYTSWLKPRPPSGGRGLVPLFTRCCSLLAGQVGNMEGSMGSGDSRKYSCLSASSAVILLAGQ